MKIKVFMLLVCICCIYFFYIYERVIKTDDNTGTKYVDKGNYIEIRYDDGTISYIGNGKTEYEDGYICYPD